MCSVRRPHRPRFPVALPPSATAGAPLRQLNRTKFRAWWRSCCPRARPSSATHEQRRRRHTGSRVDSSGCTACHVDGDRTWGERRVRRITADTRRNGGAIIRVGVARIYFLECGNASVPSLSCHKIGASSLRVRSVLVLCTAYAQTHRGRIGASRSTRTQELLHALPAAGCSQ